jgi:uncharacterized protein YdeI (YjbR/CyaY-like superfamily)
MGKVDEFEDFHPLERGAWRDWLAENHDRKSGVWFVYFKKQTGRPRVGTAEAVEEALCFGWIDSLSRRIDDERTKLLFTPRKPKSVWSKVNKARVEKLIETGEMTGFGLAKIAAAKASGAWDALTASDNLEIAGDLKAAFDKTEAAEMNFHAFPASVKKAILQWLNAAKRAETRAARIEKIVSMAARNKRARFDKE